MLYYTASNKKNKPRKLVLKPTGSVFNTNRVYKQKTNRISTSRTSVQFSSVAVSIFSKKKQKKRGNHFYYLFGNKNQK